MQDNKIYYMYCIKNIINSKIYVGVHSTSDINVARIAKLGGKNMSSSEKEKLLIKLRKEMKQSSDKLDFERAAMFRDAIIKLGEKSKEESEA